MTIPRRSAGPRARARATACATARVTVLVTAMALAGLPPAAQAAPITVVDDAGRSITLAAPAQRIVTLAPHLAELAWAAGAGDRVVAVSRFSDYPPQAAGRPVVGDAFTVDYEALARLKPDLILVWGSGTAARTKDKLRDLGWTVYEVEIRAVAGLEATLRQVGALAGTSTVAEARARAIGADWDALRAEYAGRRPVRVLFQLWDAPLMTLNGQHLVSSAITACGGRNVFAELPTLTATVSWEAAVQRDPEIVLTGGSPSEPARAGRWAEFPQVSATRAHQFARVDGDLLLRSGPRFVQGAREMCVAIERARAGRPQPPAAPEGQR